MGGMFQGVKTVSVTDAETRIRVCGCQVPLSGPWIRVLHRVSSDLGNFDHWGMKTPELGFLGGMFAILSRFISCPCLKIRKTMVGSYDSDSNNVRYTELLEYLERFGVQLLNFYFVEDFWQKSARITLLNFSLFFFEQDLIPS